MDLENDLNAHAKRKAFPYRFVFLCKPWDCKNIVKQPTERNPIYGLWFLPIWSVLWTIKWARLSLNSFYRYSAVFLVLCWANKSKIWRLLDWLRLRIGPGIDTDMERDIGMGGFMPFFWRVCEGYWWIFSYLITFFYPIPHRKYTKNI